MPRRQGIIFTVYLNKALQSNPNFGHAFIRYLLRMVLFYRCGRCGCVAVSLWYYRIVCGIVKNYTPAAVTLKTFVLFFF